MRAALAVLAAVAVMGEQVPLDMAAAAHPAVQSVVSTGAGVPIATSALPGQNYNAVGSCPSGIGCGGYSGWKPPVQKADHQVNIDVQNAPAPQKELDVYHVNDDTPQMFVNKDAMHVTPTDVQTGPMSKAQVDAIPVQKAKLEAITPVTLHEVLPMKKVKTSPVDVKLPVVKVDQIKLPEHQCPDLEKCKACVAPPEPNCSSGCPPVAPYTEECPKCKACNCPDCEKCGAECPACERPHFHVVCPKCDCGKYLSCDGKCNAPNCTKCPKPDKTLYCGRPDFWYQKAKKDLAAKEVLVAKREERVEMYKKQKMKENNETAALAEVMAYRNRLLAETNAIKDLLKKERATQKADLAKREADVANYVSNEKKRMDDIEAYNNQSSWSFELRITERKKALEVKQEELNSRRAKVGNHHRQLAEEAEAAEERRQEALTTQLQDVTDSVKREMDKKEQLFTAELTALEQRLAQKKQDLEQRKAKLEAKDRELKARETKSNLVLTPNVVIDKSGAPQLAMEKWTVA